MKTGITDVVVETVRELERATTAQVLAALSKQYSAKQITKALSYAVSGQRRLVTTRRAIPGSSVIEATYRVAPAGEDYLFTPNRPEESGPRYASVWDYAQSFEAPEYAAPTLESVWRAA